MEVRRLLTYDTWGSFSKIKVYPLITHVLKTQTGINLAGMPQTGCQLETKMAGLRGVLKKLRTLEATLGGYRIEATFSGQWEMAKDFAAFACTPLGLRRCALVASVTLINTLH